MAQLRGSRAASEGGCAYRQSLDEERGNEDHLGRCAFRETVADSEGVPADVHNDLGVAYLESKDYVGAEAEFKEALEHKDQAEQEAELGDLLFTLINIARWYGLDPSEALQGTNDRFIQRLSKMESVADRPLSDYTLDELETLWQQAKARLAKER